MSRFDGSGQEIVAGSVVLIPVVVGYADEQGLTGQTLNGTGLPMLPVDPLQCLVLPVDAVGQLKDQRDSLRDGRDTPVLDNYGVTMAHRVVAFLRKRHGLTMPQGAIVTGITVEEHAK